MDNPDRNWDAETADALIDEEEIPLSESDEAPYEMPATPRTIVVIGSSNFDDPIIVQAALLSWANHHGDRPVIMWGTGAPEGAEVAAREFAQRSGWTATEVTPERLLEIDAAVVFAFTSGESEASRLADDIAARRPVRRIDVQSLRPRSRWSSW